MTILHIHQDGAPILREIAREVTVFDDALARLASNMLETLRAYDGIGLAAPQVGVSTRLIVVAVGGIVVTMANPVITRARGQQRSLEGCLSVSRQLWNRPVARAREVCVTYQGLDGTPRQWSAKGVRAACMQHEIEHLDGILFTDKVSK